MRKVIGSGTVRMPLSSESTSSESTEQRIAALEREVERLSRSETKYRMLVDEAPDALIIVNRSGCIEYVNARAAELFGYSRDAMEGLQVDTLVPEALRSAHRAHRRDFTASPRVRAMGEGLDLLAARKDGSVVPVEISLSPLSTGEGMVVLCAIRDVTERRRAQDALRNLNATLEARVEARTAELEKRTKEVERSNQELEQFAYVASHDLQEPLRMVASYVRLLERNYRGKLDDDANEFIGYAVEGATRMQQLIQDLLKLSRIETRARTFESVSAAPALEAAVENLQLSILESGAVVTSDPLPTVLADPTQLTQVFQNLVGNAIKFRGELPPRVHVSAKRADGSWCIAVQDNGIGIDEGFRQQVFVIFQRLHPRERYPGTGIGLALCRKIVERHGGRIWVEPNRGSGSTFFFTIPEHPGGTT